MKYPEYVAEQFVKVAKELGELLEMMEDTDFVSKKMPKDFNNADSLEDLVYNLQNAIEEEFQHQGVSTEDEIA